MSPKKCQSLLSLDMLLERRGVSRRPIVCCCIPKLHLCDAAKVKLVVAQLLVTLGKKAYLAGIV
jgi:hypothetical protein